MRRLLLCLLVALSRQEVLLDVLEKGDGSCQEACCAHSSDLTLRLQTTDSFVVLQADLDAYASLQAELQAEIVRSYAIMGSTQP